MNKALNKNKIAILIYIISSLFFVIYIYNSSVNIPINDDFDALNFLIKFKSKPNINSLFAQVNEHKSFTYKAIFLTFYTVLNHINFKHLILLGILLMSIFILLIFKKKNYNFTTLFILILLYYHPSYYENLFLPEIAVVIPLTFILTFFIIEFTITKKPIPKIQLVITPILFFLCVYSNANGMLILLPLIYYLIHNKKYYYLVIFIFIIATYFIGFEYPKHHPSMIDSILKYPFKTVLYFLYIVSAFFNYETTINVYLGILLITFYIYTIIANIHKEDKTLLIILLYSIIVLIVISLGRSGFGISQALTSRYKIFSLLPLSISLIMIEFKWKKSFLLLCIFVNISSWYKYSSTVDFNNKKRVEGLIKWRKLNSILIESRNENYCKYDNSTLIYYLDDYKNKCFNTLPISIEKKIYNPKQF